jgi:hypothetical protein
MDQTDIIITQASLHLLNVKLNFVNCIRVRHSTSVAVSSLSRLEVP